MWFHIMWWTSRVLWLVIDHGLLEYKNMDDVTGNWFSLFVQCGEQFWNSLLEYVGLSKWRPQKKFSRSYLQRIRMEEPSQKAQKVFSWFFFFEQVQTVKQYEASLLGHQKGVRTSVTHWGLCATSLFLPLFDIICDLLLTRYMTTWHLFVK